MVSTEDVETLINYYFPKCPLCGASDGYEISGWAKNYVQCRSCRAKWTSTDFVTCEDLKELMLWEPSSDGKGANLLKKKRSVKFWQDKEAIEKGETKDIDTRAELIFSPNMTNEQLERLVIRSLKEITTWD